MIQANLMRFTNQTMMRMSQSRQSRHSSLLLLLKTHKELALNSQGHSFHLLRVETCLRMRTLLLKSSSNLPPWVRKSKRKRTNTKRMRIISHLKH